MRVGSTDESNGMSAMSVESEMGICGRKGGKRSTGLAMRDYFLTMTSARWKDRSAPGRLFHEDTWIATYRTVGRRETQTRVAEMGRIGQERKVSDSGFEVTRPTITHLSKVLRCHGPDGRQSLGNGGESCRRGERESG